MAITTMAGVVGALPGQSFYYWKNPLSLTAGWSSAWIVGTNPGVAPTSGLAGDIPTDATAGAINQGFANPASGNTYLGRMSVSHQHAGNVSFDPLALYDRLWHNSGISATATTAQTINSVALNRPDANGTNAEAWWETYATMGAGTPTVTLTYTNSGGTASRSGSSGALVTAMTANRTGPFNLASGDTGVKSIQTWQSSATFSAGTIGLVLRRPVALLIVPDGSYVQIDAVACGLPRVYDDACLEILHFSQSQFSSTVSIGGDLSLIQG